MERPPWPIQPATLQPSRSARRVDRLPRKQLLPPLLSEWLPWPTPIHSLQQTLSTASPYECPLGLLSPGAHHLLQLYEVVEWRETSPLWVSTDARGGATRLLWEDFPILEKVPGGHSAGGTGARMDWGRGMERLELEPELERRNGDWCICAIQPFLCERVQCEHLPHVVDSGKDNGIAPSPPRCQTDAAVWSVTLDPAQFSGLPNPTGS